MAIMAVFFDSGNTLMRPIGNRWCPGVRFFELCERFGKPVADDGDLQRACKLGFDFLEKHHDKAPDEEAEERQFAEYYRIIFRGLGRPVSDSLVAELARCEVREVNFEPYPETKPVLDAIAERGIPMAVITDAWPSARSKYEALGFLGYFAAFVISAEEKCTKPNMGMFRPALEAIGVASSEVLFVDDSPELVEAARMVGFRSVVMDHDNRHPEAVDRITDLRQVLDYVE